MTSGAINTTPKTDATPARSAIDDYPIDRIRADFPILQRQVHGKPLVYLDSAATAQKPQAVIDALTDFYTHHYGTVRRGIYALSQAATERFEAARERARRFLGAAHKEEIVFTRGTTEAINLVAASHARALLHPGDEIVISAMEHHANIVPWQLACEQTGARLRVIPMDDRGALDLDALASLLNPHTRIVSVVHVSNALGTVNPIRQIADMTHAAGALLMVDGAQSAAHMPVDVQTLGCDFFACSGHKLLGPSGVGLLYGRLDRLQAMPPYQGGGEMIDQVSFERSTYDDPPWRFEAGTPPIAQAIGLHAALDYLDAIGLDALRAWEHHLLDYTLSRLAVVPGLRIIGDPPERAGLIPFVIDGMHPFDIGTLLDHEGVAVRVGHHCAQPVMRHFDVPATVRVSFAPYNHTADIDAFIQALLTACDILA